MRERQTDRKTEKGDRDMGKRSEKETKNGSRGKNKGCLMRKTNARLQETITDRWRKNRHTKRERHIEKKA